MMKLSDNLHKEVNKRIDSIMYELVFYCESKIIDKDYKSAMEIFDSLLYWKDIRGDVNCNKKLSRRIDKLDKGAINFYYDWEND